jgi:carbonic anhydrase
VRALAAVASIALCASVLAACGGEEASPPAPPPAAAPDPDVHAEPAHWSYEGEDGPEHWGELDRDYAACGEGSEQAPVDVARPEPTDLPRLELAYRAGAVEVVDTGHTVQANAEPSGVLRVDGDEYPLVQMHFHAPSEHTIAGEHAPVEAHLVHKTEDERIAVVGLLLRAGDAPNEAWQPFVDALAVRDRDEPLTARIDWPALLPAGSVTYRYEGSLTTPPCTEGVRWFLMREPVELGTDQIAAFEAAYSGNNRPVQPLNDRTVETDADDG